MSTIKKHHNKKHNKTKKAKSDIYKDTAFYSPIKAFKTATLKVSDLQPITFDDFPLLNNSDDNINDDNNKGIHLIFYEYKFNNI